MNVSGKRGHISFTTDYFESNSIPQLAEDVLRDFQFAKSKSDANIDHGNPIRQRK
jgi:hypothetical protein